MYGLLIFSLVTLSVGWCSRVSALIACVLMTYFSMLDCVSTMTKYTAISTHLLLILALSEAGSIWSVDAWLVCWWNINSIIMVSVVRKVDIN